jgi:hypothetical protein
MWNADVTWDSPADSEIKRAGVMQMQSYLWGDSSRAIAHLPWHQRDQIMEAVHRRNLRKKRWIVLALSALPSLFFFTVLWTNQFRTILGLMSIILLSFWNLIFPFWMRRSGIRRALHAELLERGIRPRVCPLCGYDLRESKECCPECGAPLAPVPAKPSE